MKAYLTATRLATKLQMLRSGKKRKAFMVVEGITDYRLYSKLINRETCEVIIGESKHNVVEAIRICEMQQVQGVIGIVDADFWHLDGISDLPRNLFLTDAHDLECMMLQSPAYESVLLEYGDENKVARFEQKMHQSLKEILLMNVALIGYLRRISLKYELAFGFSHLNFLSFTSSKDLKIDEVQLVDSLLCRSKKKGAINLEQVMKWLDDAKRQPDDLWQVCCGHDLMSYLTLGLNQIFGNYNAKHLFSGQLEGSFRLAYEEKYFLETKLYRDLEAWERCQKNYRVFKPMDKVV